MVATLRAAVPDMLAAEHVRNAKMLFLIFNKPFYLCFFLSFIFSATNAGFPTCMDGLPHPTLSPRRRRQSYMQATVVYLALRYLAEEVIGPALHQAPELFSSFATEDTRQFRVPLSSTNSELTLNGKQDRTFFSLPFRPGAPDDAGTGEEGKKAKIPTSGTQDRSFPCPGRCPGESD